MPSTKEAPGPFDGMAKAHPDEPVFTLRAHDESAPQFVFMWVDARRMRILAAYDAGEISKAKRDLELMQCLEAEAIGWAMQEWHAGERGAELQAEDPEEEATPAPSYSGHVSSADELEAKRIYEIIKASGQVLANAIAGIHEVATERLPELGMETHRAVLLECKDRIHAVADSMAPKRASYHAGQGAPPPLRLADFTISGRAFNHRVRLLEADDADPSGE